jgi:hypothetical protein
VLYITITLELLSSTFFYFLESIEKKALIRRFVVVSSVAEIRKCGKAAGNSYSVLYVVNVSGKGTGVNPANAADREDGISLRTAAVIAGFGYLLSPVSYAEFTLMPKRAGFRVVDKKRHQSFSKDLVAEVWQLSL